MQYYLYRFHTELDNVQRTRSLSNAISNAVQDISMEKYIWVM